MGVTAAEKPAKPARPAAVAAERVPEFALSLALTTRAARDVLGLAASGNGKADGPPGEGAELSESAARDRGAEALAQLLDPRQTYSVYLRNAGSSGEGEQVVELRLATDGSAASNAGLVEQLGGKSLLLVGAEKEDRHSGDSEFVLFSVRAIPDVWGQKDAWSQPARVKFGAGEGGFPPRLLAAIAKMPEPKAQRETVQRRLGDWRRYLGILERTAKARQFSITYKAFRRGPSANQLIFTLDPGREPIAWDKLRSAVDEPLEVRERRGPSGRNGSGAPGEDDDADDWLLGYIVECAPDKNEVRLALDDETEKLLEHRTLALPRSAALVYKAAGDLAQVRRLKFGLELLEQGYGENPRLSEFMFDAAQARLPDPARRVTLERAELLQPRLNEGQRAAVEGALNAPDLFLIQGPPGTGKTTVIAEICYQNALRGQRTLIASQSNLAVDNALSRLVHHPRIRALRRGRAERVEVEGAPFLEDQVVGTWLAKTAGSCEQDLAARRDRIRRFEELLANRGRLETLAAALRTHAETRPKHAAAVTGLELQIPGLKQQADQLARSLERRRSAQASLHRLQAALAPGGPDDALPADHADRAGDAAAHAGAAHNGAAAIAELQPDDLALLDRLQVGEHPALQRLREAGQELNAALDNWDKETPEASEEDAARPGFAATLRDAAGVRQRTKINSARVADLRASLDQLHQTGVDWLASRDQAEGLDEERASLSATEASLRARREALEAEQASLQTKLQELANFDAAQASVGAALRGWVERLTGGGAPGGLGTPPPEFGSPLRREIWAAASQAAQLHKLSALALEVRTARAEAQRFAELAVKVSTAAEPLLTDLNRRAPPTPRRGAAARAAHWRQSGLRGLVSLDVHGDLHPAFAADTAWGSVERQLTQLRQKPAWLAARLGAEQRRQQALALWVQRLSEAANDFSKRREALEGLARHRAARLQERTEATAEALELEVGRAAQLFGPQAEQRLAEVKGVLAEVSQAQPAVTARLDELDQEMSALAEGQGQRAQALQAGLEALGEARRTRAFQHLLRQVGPEAGRIAVDDWSRAWQAATGTLDEAVEHLRVLAAALDPLGALESVAADLELDAAKQEQKAEQARQQRRVLEQDLQSARERLRLADDQLGRETAWWRAVHAALPERLRASAGATGASPDSLAYVEAMLTASAGWQADLQQEQAYLTRAEGLVNDWVRRLRAAGPRDSADLKQIYIDNANVIGITCVQAGAYQFSRAYRNFDCVVVDEVSKATPPELLLPMLKGARVVLVGDHRQLPPMIGPETLADLASEMEVPAADLAHLERSLFKELFEMAPEALRVMLTEQYRMHPQIMDAINQFYSGKLTSGIADPDRARAHGFNLPWLRPENHLVWINTPTEGPFVEQRLGTTYMNAGEVDVILRLVQALDSAWAPQVAAGKPPKEVGVITFYGAQVRELKSRLIERAGRYKNLRLRVGTVDRFQGMERPIIIASLVRNNDHGSVGFARKPERVNVAFSRAQELLVIVGSRELFCERAREGAAFGPNGARTGERDGDPATTAIYGRVAEVVQRAGGQRRTSDVSDDFKR